MSSRGWKLSKTLIITLIVLPSCTTTEQANQALETRFKGSSADSFFLSYGPPSSGYRLGDGGMLYTWDERPKVYHIAGHADSTVIGDSVYTSFSPGRSVSIQCSLKIHTNAAGNIESIDVLNDSIGAWEMSRCHEVFGKPK